MNWYPAQRSLPLCCDKFSANFSSVYGFALGNQTTRCKQTLMPKTKLKITDLQRLKLETYRLFQKLAAEEKCSKMDLINNYKAVIAV